MASGGEFMVLWQLGQCQGSNSRCARMYCQGSGRGHKGSVLDRISCGTKSNYCGKLPGHIRDRIYLSKYRKASRATRRDTKMVNRDSRREQSWAERKRLKLSARSCNATLRSSMKALECVVSKYCALSFSASKAVRQVVD